MPTYRPLIGFLKFTLPVSARARAWLCVLRNLSVYLSYSAGGNIRVSSAVAAAAVDMNMLIGRRGGAAEEGILYSAVRSEFRCFRAKSAAAECEREREREGKCRHILLWCSFLYPLIPFGLPTL